MNFATLIPIFLGGSLGMALSVELFMTQRNGRWHYLLALLSFSLIASLLPIKQYGIGMNILFIVSMAGLVVGFLEVTLIKVILIVTRICTYEDIYGSKP